MSDKKGTEIMNHAQLFQDRVEGDRAVLESAMEPHHLPDGQVIRMAMFGEGPIVVCPPTIAELNFVYLPQIRHLQHRFTFVIYEPRVSVHERVSVIDRTLELAAVVDAVGGQAHVLSWSDGGSAAYRFATEYPSKCLSTTFLGLADRYRLPGPLNQLAHLIYSGRVDRLVPQVAIRMLLSWFLGGPRAPRRWIYAETGRLPQLRHLLRFTILPCMVEHAPREPVQMAALLIGGDHDALVNVRSMARMSAILGSRASFVTIPGGEHILGYTAPEQVNAALDEFLTRYQTGADSRPTQPTANTAEAR
jgi:pimeloyl-ACP methyl ester carboxylesterase